MSDDHEKRVLAGYKAALHNPHTTDEGKSKAETALRKAGVDVDALELPPTSPTKATSSSPKTSKAPMQAHEPAELDEHMRRVLAGYKASLKSKRTGDEAKDKARRKIAQIEGSTYKSEEDEDKHYHHVLGGYKATLHNPRTSDDAKEHAREMLRAEGIDPDDL